MTQVQNNEGFNEFFFQVALDHFTSSCCNKAYSINCNIIPLNCNHVISIVKSKDFFLHIEGVYWQSLTDIYESFIS